MQHLHYGNLMRFLKGNAEPELETGAPHLESVAKWKIIENIRRNLKIWNCSLWILSSYEGSSSSVSLQHSWSF